MRPLLITVGSRGDVQPYLALACGLLAAGHRPLLAAPRRFEALVRARGVDFAPLDDEMLTLGDSVKGQGVRAAITAARSVRPMLRRLLDDQAGLAVPGEFDLVVYHPKSLGGPYVPEKAGVPALAGLLVPLYLPTSAFPCPILPVRLPRPLNRASWRVTSAIEAPYRGAVRAWRRDRLGLRTPFRPMSELIRQGAVLHAWSPHLLPAPDDWPPEARPTGFWTMPADHTWTPPEPLARFLAEGDPPVYVGFGSSIGGDPAALTATVLEALRLSGRRAVLATGWGALRPGHHSSDILVIEEAPPRLAAPTRGRRRPPRRRRHGRGGPARGRPPGHPPLHGRPALLGHPPPPPRRRPTPTAHPPHPHPPRRRHHPRRQPHLGSPQTRQPPGHGLRRHHHRSPPAISGERLKHAPARIGRLEHPLLRLRQRSCGVPRRANEDRERLSGGGLSLCDRCDPS